jgi:hypothetical protein
VSLLLRPLSVPFAFIGCCSSCCGGLVQACLTSPHVAVEVTPDELVVGRPGRLVIAVENDDDEPHVIGLVDLPDELDEQLTVQSSTPRWTAKVRHPRSSSGRADVYRYDRRLLPGERIELTFEVVAREGVRPMGSVEVCADPDLLTDADAFHQRRPRACDTDWVTVPVRGAPERDDRAERDRNRRRRRRPR